MPRSARYRRRVAEGDTIHRNARRLRAALGDGPLVRAEAPSPRSTLRGQPGRLAALVGRRLERADAHGKHLFLRFEGGLVLHSHQGMNGSWHTYRPGERWRKPRSAAWAVLATERAEAVEFGGTSLVLRTEGELRLDPRLRALGPDILAPDLDPRAGARAVRERAPQGATLGEALLDQTVLAGVGNIFKSEGCWRAGIDPWRRLAEVEDGELEAVVAATRELMLAAVERGRAPRRVYRAAGRPCPRCGTPIRSRGQGDTNRTTYWCPGCQR
jgi:endonuclease-8